MRATLQGDGSFALTGVGLPEGAPFEAVVRCMEGELRSVRHDPVLTPRSFEATIQTSVAISAPRNAPPQARAPRAAPAR